MNDIDLTNDFIEYSILLENTLSELYKYFASIYSEHYNFWDHLSKDELIHATMIKKTSNIFSKNSKYLSVNVAIIARLKSFIENINHQMESFKIEPITHKQALKLATELEQSSMEIHFHSIIQDLKMKEINELLLKLQEEDKKHIKKLQSFM